VQLCIDAGVGATLALRLGGKLGPTSGSPLDLEVQVMAIDPKAQQSSGSPGEDPTVLGAAAWVQVEGIDIVLISRREQCYHPDAFSRMGIDLSRHRAVVVKSTNHFHAQFAPIAGGILYVDSPGALPPDMSKIPFRTFSRPYWPRTENPWESDGFESEDVALKVG
jgi:microcystin degradation protein MlrC